MQLIQTADMLAPNVCVICESTPTTDTVIDTLYRIPGFTKLSGRKYVCEQCVVEFAQLLGYEKGIQVQKAGWERDQARKEVAHIRQRIDEFAKTLGEAVNHPGVVDGSTFEDVFGPAPFADTGVKTEVKPDAPKASLPDGAAVTSTIGSASADSGSSPTASTATKESNGSSGQKG